MRRAIIPALVGLFVWFAIIGPIIEQAASDVLDKLGSSSFCPEEFKTSDYKVCFTADGDVVVDGKVSDKLRIEIEGTGNYCTINSGRYSFEYAGCRLDKFKQIEAYDLVLITNKGKVLINGKKLLDKVAAGYEIISVAPKGVRILRQALPLIRFLGF